MEFQFNLPLNISDLLNSSGDNYYVKNLYNTAEIPEKLKLCKQMLFENDPFYIFDHFDTYYSVIEQKGTDYSIMVNLMRAFDLMYVTVDKLGNSLATFLVVSEPAKPQDRIKYLNLTKMCLFLLINIVRKIDGINLQIQQQQQTNQKSKRGRAFEGSKEFPEWEAKRNKFLVQLYNIMQFPLEKLWSPPIAEESFVNLLCDACYRILETLHMRSDSRHVVDTVFQIFGTAIKRYQHAINFPIKVLQLLRNIEHAANSVAFGINLLHEEYGITTIFSVLIKEITECLSMDTADTMVSRNFSNFLMELATISPKLMIPHLSVLCDELLNCESHVLRNCILQIMGDAILGELTSEDLSDDMKETRNEFLEYLLMHVNDISAHVRVKVLQIWYHLKEEHAVPLSFQLKVLSSAVERLEDKTSSVRKHAIQLIKAFLERNPFAPNLTLAELQKKHSEEVRKMEELTELLAEERKKADEIEEKWSDIILELLPFVEEIVKKEQINPIETTTQETYEDLVQLISTMLLEKEYKKAVELVRKADYVAGNSELRLSLNYEEQCAYYVALLKSYIFLANGCKDSNEELGTQIKTVQFLQDSMEFSKMISQAMPKLLEMLSSKTNSDVFEAVDLFTTSYMFGIKGTEIGMKQILYLVWSSDKEKRDAVSDAYKKVLFTTDGQHGRAHAMRVAQNLSQFLETCELGHYMAMERLIEEWINSNDIDSNIIQVLFERFTLKLDGTTENESRLALRLLIMCSSTKSSIASANTSIIESIGLGERGKNNPLLYADCLEFMLNTIDNTLSTPYYKRYEVDSSIVQKVTDIYIRFFMNPHIEDFDEITTSTIQFFYQMCQTPDLIAEKLITELLRKFQTSVMKIKRDEEAQINEETPYSQPVPQSQNKTIRVLYSQQQQQQQQTVMPVILITRFVFMIGFVVLKEMIFLDIDVYNNMKYRQELSECEEKKKKKIMQKNSRLSKRLTANLNMSATESLKRLSVAAAEPQQEPDEDLVGATAEDNVAELINHICEDVLLHHENALLAKIFPYIFEICKYPAKYEDKNLQQAATTALIRFMCVSSNVCHTNMPFLMNILSHTKHITIKCNIVIGLSDLTFRFPNIIEPWTGLFYTTLHEENTEVRLTAVKMLSHLLLHEMIRVKGQIADLAMCIVDDNDEIRNITEQFFKEIAHKSNILYNVLPDIISKLSDMSLNLEEEKYHIIMRYILSLIQKDRQVETLVEKLCLRFPVTREERQWRDIAYCLSLLSYNEKTIKKLIDNVQYYKDKLQIDEVYQSFKLIINNTSKLAKPEVKVAITELENRIEECLKVNDEQHNNSDADNDSDRRTKSQSNKNKTAPPKKKNRPNNRRRVALDNTEGSSSDEELTKRKSDKVVNRNRSARTMLSESNVSRYDEGERRRQPIRTTNSTQRTKVITDSASSEDNFNIPQRKKGRNNN